MPRIKRSRPAEESAEQFHSRLATIQTADFGGLRGLWRERFKADPPKTLSKDLVARILAYDVQEKRLGGLSRETQKLLASVARTGLAPPRRLKIGSVLVREHQGVTHEVIVTPDGFLWQGTTWASLSGVALKITGKSWNGYKFFGILKTKPPAHPRDRKPRSESLAPQGRGAPQQEADDIR
jgi:hypothetical protein